MSLVSDGKNKMVEELSELIQVSAKLIENANRRNGLVVNLEEEIADVMATCKLVIGSYGLSIQNIEARVDEKLRKYIECNNNK